MQYTIIRVYAVPGDSQRQAQERFIEAVELGVERDFHVRDYCRGFVPEQSPRVAPKSRTRSWWALIREQLLGR